jgi:molecular chaperone Hsp33
MEDYIINATAAGGTIRALAAVTTNIVKDAQMTHSLSAVASAALGRTLTVAGLMSKIIEGRKR